MKNELKSPSWQAANEYMMRCHLSIIMPESVTESDWDAAFAKLIQAIKEEREENPTFAEELDFLSEDTSSSYDFKDILTEYFVHLEKNGRWEAIIDSCDALIENFKWEKTLPSKFMYKKAKALKYSGRIDDAERFAAQWLKLYPKDLYAAASAVYLYTKLENYGRADEIVKQYWKGEEHCNEDNEIFFIAAYKLYIAVGDDAMKEKIQKEIAEYTVKLIG